MAARTTTGTRGRKASVPSVETVQEEVVSPDLSKFLNPDAVEEPAEAVVEAPAEAPADDKSEPEQAPVEAPADAVYRVLVSAVSAADGTLYERGQTLKLSAKQAERLQRLGAVERA